MDEWKSDPRGQAAVDFINKLTLIGDYTGEPFNLMSWQETIVRRIYGDRTPDGKRRIKKCFLFIPRKVGKTQLAAAIGLVQLFLGPPGQEIYAASSDRERAGRLFKAMAQMLRADPHLLRLVDITDYYMRIKLKGRDSVFQTLAADQSTGNALSPSTLILDEIHLWRHAGREMYSALTTGKGARKKGCLEILISTAGARKEGLCWDLYSDAKNVANGIVSDPSFVPFIYEAPPDADWTSPEVWARAIPSLGAHTQLSVIQELCEEAKRIKWRELDFRRYYLNQWVEGEADTWVSLDEFKECREDYSEADCEGEEASAGLDLSSVRDLTSLSLYFPHSGRVLSWSWLPSEGLADREEKDGVTYRRWVRDGLIFTTTGSRIRHEEVAAKINQILRRFNVTKFVADPASLNLIVPYLDQAPEQYPQSPMWMSPPTKWLESAIAEKKIRYNGNPLLEWCLSNVVVEHDRYENLSPHKGKSRKRIDPVVALIMAIGAHIGTDEPTISANDFYSDRSNFILDAPEPPKPAPAKQPIWGGVL